MSIQYTADQLQRKFQGAPGAGGFARIAEVLREEGRHEEALALCQEGLAARPGNVTGMLVLGKIHLDMDKLEEARAQFEAVLRQDPRCLSALHLLARLMAKMQWQDAAAAYYRSILELEPWDTETLARLRDLAPSGATADGFVPAPAEPSGYPDAGAAPAQEGVIEEFNLDTAADFVPAEPSPGDLAGALEEVSLEDALGATSAPAVPYAPPAGPADLAEPKPMDILPSAPPPVPDGAEEINEPAPISGDDVGERLDSLFGVQDDGPIVKPAPAAPEAFPAEATLQMPAFSPEPAMASAPPETSGQAVDLPASSAAPMEQGLSPLELEVAGEPGDLGPEDRVSGEDIENRLDALFSLTEEAIIPPAPAQAPSAAAADAPYSGETVIVPAFGSPAIAASAVTAGFGEVAEAPETAEAATGEVAEVHEVAGAPEAAEVAGVHEVAEVAEVDEGRASATADRPAFLGDEPALGPFSAAPESPAAETPAFPADEEPVPQVLHPMPEDVILSAGPDAASTALGPDEVVTGQDVADKLDALFGEPAPRTEPAPSFEAAGRTPADTGIFPPPDSLPTGSASWAAARPADEMPGGADTQAGVASAFDLPPDDATGLLSTESMLPRGIGGDSAPPVTGADIEDRLDSLFNLGEEAAPSAGIGPATGAESAFADVPPAPPAEPDRTMIMPVQRESASDWLARHSDEESPAGAAPAGAQPPLGNLPEAPDRLPGAGDTLFISNEDVFGAGPEAPASPTASHGAGDTVGMEMVDASDIEGRLDQIFSPEEAAAQAAKAAAEAAIASGEANLEGDLVLPQAGGDFVLPEIVEPAMETGEMPLPIEEEGILAQDSPAPSVQDEIVDLPPSGTMVSGEDVRTRLSEIFESEPREPDIPAGREAEAAPELAVEPSRDALPELEAFPEPDGLVFGTSVSETVETADTAPPAGGSATRAPAASLAPLEDEEGAPEDEENAPQSAAGANVATVTLAEIYFQQGLREQALQIYRQLLEREPGNESVRTRIQEIEASKPEAGPGTGADPRRPRPGLKVPKRKK